MKIVARCSHAPSTGASAGFEQRGRDQLLVWCYRQMTELAEFERDTSFQIHALEATADCCIVRIDTFYAFIEYTNLYCEDKLWAEGGGG